MKNIKVLCALLALVMVFALSSSASERTGKVLEFQGSVDVKIGGADWAEASKDIILNQGDIIRTGANSMAMVEIDNAGVVEVKENSELMLAELTTNSADNSKRTVLDLSLGEILVKAKKLTEDNSRFEVKTPTSVVGVRGTEFAVKVDKELE